MKNTLKPFRDFLDQHNLLPKYNEDTTFLMIVALAVIYFVDPSAQREIFETLKNSEKATLIVGIGAIFTIYTTFFTSFKTELQKHYILWFAIIINAVVGVTVIETIQIQGLGPIWYVFPFLNLASFFLVILFWYTNLYDSKQLGTKSIRYENIIYGSVILLIISQILKFIPNMSWQVIFSSSIAYATYFSNTVVSYLPKIFPSKNNKIELISHLVEKGTGYALELINTGEGLRGNSLLIITEDKEEHRSIPEEKFNNLDEYLIELIKKEFKGKNVATLILGYYDWKQSWWNKTKSYQALIIDVQILGESHRYEFCQIIENKDGKYEVGEKGLIYLNKKLWG